MSGGPSNISEILSRIVSASPDQAAFIFKDHKQRSSIVQKSFHDFLNECNASVSVLYDFGVREGSRVLLFVKPGYDLCIVFYALLKLGAVPVLIDPGMKKSNLLNSIIQSKPDFLVGSLRAIAISRFYPSVFKPLKKKIHFKGKAWNQKLTKAQRLDCESDYTVSADGNVLAAVLFTSGSTGFPKGVCYEHSIFWNQILLLADSFKISPGEVDLSLLPAFTLFAPVLGMTSVVPEMNPSKPSALNPYKITNQILKYGVTNSFGSPVLWSKMARFCKESNIQLPSLKRIIMAGASSPVSLFRDLQEIAPEAEIYTPYGATEALPITAVRGFDLVSGNKRSQVGTCLGKVLSPNRVEIKPLGKKNAHEDHFVVGEICVSGPVVTRRYDFLPGATANAKFIDEKGDLWHRMGDLGFLDSDNNLWFAGRKAEYVETPKGVLFTDFCEQIFNVDSSVEKCALIGLGDRPFQVPALVVEPRPGCYPYSRRSKKIFIERLKEIGSQQDWTRDVKTFFFKKKLPVDVRHNAKIHRLKLAKDFSRRINNVN